MFCYILLSFFADTSSQGSLESNFEIVEDNDLVTDFEVIGGESDEEVDEGALGEEKTGIKCM